MTKTEIDKKIKIIETTEFKSIEECARYAATVVVGGIMETDRIKRFLSSLDIVPLALSAICFTMRTIMAT